MENTAVVIGAGMAGLVAARVLSDRFTTVVVLDRDALPTGPDPRRGVPQGTQPHILLVSGLQELTGLFPGFDDELVASGGTRLDTGSGLCTYRYDRRWPQEPVGYELISVSRPHLEALVRARVVVLPGVEIRDETAVSGLAGADGRVTGVVLDSGETLAADLVVDCSGRGARSDRWLAALGLPAPEQVEIKVGVSYSTRVYRRRPGDLPGWQAAFTLPTAPAEKATGLAVPIEGDRWLIGMGGWHLADPPTDPAAFEAAARSLPDPIIADLLTRAEPLSDVVMFRFPSSRRRLFEKLDRLPVGYVALGDSVCSFNPIYGQGMTCAAREATALGAALDAHSPESFARHYYAAVAALVAIPWSFAVGSDFGYPETTGPRPRGIALRNWFSRRIAYASQVDSEVNRAFVGVQQLLVPPDVLFKPRFVLRVLRQARRRLRSEAPPLTAADRS
ncbi:FAD-dependent oxidoreductase [Actinoplanes sp. NPDC051343]|uniref:FAD-dependent oxidoreductase n=1 Tax=Actinoplanes sp. NPDC051343 TaxID=3363906 RepID=UPI0037AE6439